MENETYFAKAIILNRQDFKENDLKITFFCAERGRVEAVARGAKKSQAKLTGHLEPLNEARVMIVRGRQYDYLGSLTSDECFLNIKTDFGKSFWTARAVGDFGRLLFFQKENEAEKFYKSLKDYLSFMNETKTNELEAKFYYCFFIYKIIDLLGLRPNLDFCTFCNQKIKIEENNFYFLSHEGLICQNCQPKKGIKTIKAKGESILIFKNKANKGSKKIKTEQVEAFYQVIQFWLKCIAK